MKQLYLLRGAPGSGKSFIAKQLIGGTGIIHSTDNYFLVNGEYKFESNKLSYYHRLNLEAAVESMRNGISPIIIDNTNTTSLECSEYYHAAIGLGYKVKIREPSTPWAFDLDELCKRNTHNVPRNSIRAMLDRYESMETFTINLGFYYTSNNSKEFWEKGFCEEKFPSQVLDKTVIEGDVDDLIFRLISCEQNPEHHPEGNAYEHTKQVVNWMAKIVRRENIVGRNRIILMLSALCHDFGKPYTTRYRIVRGVNKITSWGHEAVGAKLTRNWLSNIGFDEDVINRVIVLIKEHLCYIPFKKNGCSKNAINNVAQKLYPMTIKDLLYLVESDSSGRSATVKTGEYNFPEILQIFKQRAIEEEVFDNPYKAIEKLPPVIKGKDILDRFPNIEKTKIGEMISKTKIYTDKEEALEWIKENYVNIIKNP